MTDLIKFSENQDFSSLKVAEITGKRHDNVMRDIDDEIEKIGHDNAALIFEVCTYKAANGKQISMYKMNKNGWLQIGARYDAQTRFTLISYVDKLEQKQQLPQLPQTFSEALRALAVEVEKKEQLALQVNNLETVLDIRLDWVSILKIAQFNKVSEKLFDWHKLKTKSKELGYEIKRAESVRYKYQNLYHVNVFRACYPKFNYNIKL